MLHWNRPLPQLLSRSAIALLPLVFSPLNASSQQPGSTPTCGFDHWHQHRMQQDAAYRDRVLAFDSLARNPNSAFQRSSTVYRVPVVVHVMESGTFTISDDQIREAIRGANERFRKVEGTAGDGDGVDTGIEFVLAVRDPDGNCTNGINRVDMRWNSAYMSHGVVVFSPDGLGLDDVPMMMYQGWDRQRYMNVYVVNRLREGTMELAGRGMFSSAHGASFDAVMMVESSMRRNSTVLAHEFGHNLNLYHTFQGQGETTCPANDDCTLQGDRVCDTPPHRSSEFVPCSPPGTNPCDGGSTTELIRRNYMDYTSCGSMFTAGQAARMVLALTTDRASYLAENGNLALVPPGTPPTVEIDVVNGACTAAFGSVKLIAQANTCMPTTFPEEDEFESVEFAWSITNGTQTFTSTSPVAAFEALPPGIYDASVTVTTPFGSVTRSRQGLFRVLPAAPACTPSFNPGAITDGAGVRYFRVTWDRMFWFGEQPIAEPTYQPIICDALTPPIVIPPDLVFLNMVTTEVAIPHWSKWYIDWNNNGIFEEPAELVWSKEHPDWDSPNAVIPVPQGVTQGIPLRMRLCVDRAPITVDEVNCLAPFTFAHVVDLVVYAGSTPPLPPMAGVQVLAPGTSVLYGSPYTFTAQPTNGGPSPSYTWFRNGHVVGTGQLYTTNTLLPGDSVWCEMVSNLPGVMGSPARSTKVSKTVIGKPLTDFDAFPRIICPGQTVNFIDRTLLNATNLTWSFPGGSPSTSTMRHPVVTYPLPGVYAVTLTTSNNMGTNGPLTKTSYIRVEAPPIPACASFVRTLPPNSGIGIHYIRLGELAQGTPWNDDAYNDYTCWYPMKMRLNTTYSLEARVSGTVNQWVRVYIDYNRNGSFNDPGEQIFSSTLGTGMHQGTFTTPAHLPLGVPMRVRFVSDIWTTIPGPCPALASGQVEDYSVYFEQVDCQGTVNGTAIPGTPCNDSQLCTVFDTWNAQCECVGIPLPDADGDGICDLFDPCVNGPNPGIPCNDGDPCTFNDVIQADCSCLGTSVPDTDGDGICDAIDSCPNIPGQVGSPCDDGNPNTQNDVLGANCLCNGLVVYDDVCNAVALGIGVNGPFSNVGATAQGGEPQPPLGSCTGQVSWRTSGGPANNSVWFTFTAPLSGRVSLNFGNTATWDSRIALWSAPTCNALLMGMGTLVAANDDITGAFPYHAAIEPICVEPLQQYYVQVDGWGSVANGAFQLVLVEEPPLVDATVSALSPAVCPGDPAVFEISGTPDAAVTYLLDWGSPQQALLTNGSLAITTPPIGSETVLSLYSITNGSCVRGFNPQSDIATVDLASAPVVELSAMPTSLCAGNNTQLLAAVESGATYCTTGLYTNGCVDGDAITQVVFAGMVRNSTCDGGGAGYSLLTSPQTHVQAGQAYAFSMVTGAAYPQGGAAWIDWDQNGQFEPHELLVSGYLGTNGASYANTNVVVPANARNGRTRLRVRCAYGVDPANLGCGPTGYGEVEDYHVHVTGGIGEYFYDWSTGAAVVEPTAGNTLSLPMQENSTYQVHVTNANGCTSTATVNVAVVAPPRVVDIERSSDNVCVGEDVQLRVVLEPAPSGCLPTQANGGCAGDEYIAEVTFGAIVNASGCSLPVGYEDFTDRSATVHAGATGLQGTVTIGNPHSGDQLGVWFDWDQDGAFDPVLEAAVISGGPAAWTFSVNVPWTAKGGATRMRVRVVYQTTPLPCDGSAYGEAEDYTVVVLGGNEPVGFVWAPITGMITNIVPDPMVTDLQGTTNFSVTVTGSTGCGTQAGVTIHVNGIDTDGDGEGDCSDPCPLVYGAPGDPCDDGDPGTTNDVLHSDCTCQGVPAVLLELRVKLEGPYASSTGLMNDALRSLPSFPLVEPYTALGYGFVGGGGETVEPTALLTSGPDAIVDWVVVELRHPTNSGLVVASRAALLQRDGDVVDLDGQAPVGMTVPGGGYHVAVRHRNHLGLMTATPVPLFEVPIPLDLSNATVPVYGTDARRSVGGTHPAMVLWAGDVTFNNQLKYSGSGNDRDPILVRIGGVVPSNTVTGYHSEDCNLDGVVKYAGSGNDRDIILINIGGMVPTNVRQGQLP